jgi:hypothetical protein
MPFSTVTFTGTAAGSSGPVSATGVFTAAITGNSDGTVSGTWTFNGVQHLSGTISGSGSTTGPWNIVFSGPELLSSSGTLSFASGQYSLGVNEAFYVSYTVSGDYGGNFTYEYPVQIHADLSADGAAPAAGGGTAGADTLGGTAGADTITGLGGNDTVTGGAGNDTIDGGTGIDTAVFSDVRTNYTVTHVSANTWTVAHTGADGTDTLTDVERLRFSDSKLAIDIDGDGGKAYRLYQAAFDRVPDVPGLGYQMNDLDMGFSLSQVAANFIASPEFQLKYGTNLTDSEFVTLLYQHVLHRVPQQFEVDYHVDQELHAGYSRADVLTFFAESNENQANVIGTIGAGMVYVFP